MILDPPILAAFVSAIIAIVSWFVLHVLSTRKEDRLRRIEAARAHIQKQIEEFYGPLLGLIQYGNVINEIERQRLPRGVRNEKEGEILYYFREKYYLPLNSQMSNLIRTKIYLLDSDGLPESFQQFLMHAAQFQCFHDMYKDIRVQSHDVMPIKYPETFKKEVEETLDRLIKNYRKQINLLKLAT